MFGFVASDVRVEIECFLMDAVDDASDGVLGIGATI